MVVNIVAWINVTNKMGNFATMEYGLDSYNSGKRYEITLSGERFLQYILQFIRWSIVHFEINIDNYDSMDMW